MKLFAERGDRQLGIETKHPPAAAFYNATDYNTNMKFIITISLYYMIQGCTGVDASAGDPNTASQIFSAKLCKRNIGTYRKNTSTTQTCSNAMHHNYRSRYQKTEIEPRCDEANQCYAYFK